MRASDLKFLAVGLALLTACSSKDALAPGHGADAGDEDAGTSVKPPPQDEIFLEKVVETDSNGDGFINDKDDLDPMDGMIDTATRYLFDERTFDKYCVVPDADSFDDLENVDPNTGQILIRRGVTPVTQACEADGIATGPLHDELYPSKWCKKKNCTPTEK